jgi:hypothetical protein
MNIMVNPRFAESILNGRKIHTIRQNYDFWKRFDGKECGIRVWKGKPYRSGQHEICRKIISVCPMLVCHDKTTDGPPPEFYGRRGKADTLVLAMNDGFFDSGGNVCEDDFTGWFHNYPDGILAVLHWTDYRY